MATRPARSWLQATKWYGHSSSFPRLTARRALHAKFRTDSRYTQRQHSKFRCCITVLETWLTSAAHFEHPIFPDPAHIQRPPVCLGHRSFRFAATAHAVLRQPDWLADQSARRCSCEKAHVANWPRSSQTPADPSPQYPVKPDIHWLCIHRRPCLRVLVDRPQRCHLAQLRATRPSRGSFTRL